MDEKELLYRAIINSYEVITRKKTVAEIEEYSLPAFIHEPDKGIDKKSIKVMVIYFLQEEDYLKCKELSDEYEILFNEKMPSLVCGCRCPELQLIDDDTIQCKSCRTRIA